jgi:hypothetical protein
MANLEYVQHIQTCIDEYMVRTGKHEINEMEANIELARVGLLDDDVRHPGAPLRELLISLRDSNLLPQNIRQVFGSWKIKNSRTLQKMIQIMQF